MKLTTKLLSYLHRIFDKDPQPFLALRLRYAGASMQWRVQDAHLTTVPVGGIGAPLSVDLTQFTLVQLVAFLAAQPGYTVEYIDNTELSQMGAGVLLDAAGDQDKTNGDHLYGYTNVLWSYMEANARELDEAARQIDQMRLQMSTKTASDAWLDELGGYYGVPRLQSELDRSYSQRIIAEVLRPRSNNIAIAEAIRVYTGQVTKVTDVVVNSGVAPLFNGARNFDGVASYNAVSSPLYGLFDVEYGYDILNGGDISAFSQIVRDLINRLRSAGTHLRALSLSGSLLQDTVAAPTDADTQPVSVGVLAQDTADESTDDYSASVFMATMTEATPEALDGLTMALATNYTFNASRRFDGSINYSGISSGNAFASVGAGSVESS